MASTGAAALFAILVISSCAVSSVRASLEDGRPRPKNFPDLPTVTYDATPALSDSNGDPVNCIWYGFANSLYDTATTDSCLQVLRKALTNATVNPPSQMQPYTYYTLKRLIDPSNNQSYCYQGCFNLGASAPTPGAVGVPPPLSAAAPPPLTFGVPPSSSSGPSVYPGAPPPLGASSPLGAAVPPASIFPPTLGPAASPFTSPPAPAVATPSSGAFLQPATLFSFLVAFVAVFVNLIA